MRGYDNKKKQQLLSILLIASLAFSPIAAFAADIEPSASTVPSDYQIYLIDEDTYIKFGANIYAEQIQISGVRADFTEASTTSTGTNNLSFGVGMQLGNMTINGISENLLQTALTCTVSTHCYPFYYYELGESLSSITVTQGSTETEINAVDFITDPAAFSVATAPAVFWEQTSRYYQVKVLYNGATSVEYEKGGGGTGVEPVSFESVGTVYSVASDPDFQRVYQDTPNDLAIFLDASQVNGTTFESAYNVNTQVTTNTAVNISEGANTVDSDAYVSPVELNEFVWTVGRDSSTGDNVYALRNTNGLAAVNATSETSSFFPRDIAQSTTALYSPLYDNSTTNGAIILGSMDRDYTNYDESVTLHTGTSGVPVIANIASQTAQDGDINLVGGSQTVAVETFTASAEAIGEEFDRLSVMLSTTDSPTALITFGTFDNSGNAIETFGTLDSSTLTGTATFYNVDFDTPYTVQSGDRIGVKYTGATHVVEVHRQSGDPYDGTNAHASFFDGGWNDLTTIDTAFILGKTSQMKSIVYDGSPDTIYTFFESDDEIRTVKRTGSTSLIATAMEHMPGEPYKVIQLTDKILIQTATKFYILNTDTDAISELHPNAFNTRYAQTYQLSPGGRTFSSDPVYIANSTNAYNFIPNLGTVSSTGVIVESTNDATGTINVFAPAKYYYLTAFNITAEAATVDSTEWDLDQLSTLIQLAPTAYSEQVGISLVQNSTLFTDDVFRLVCDASAYHYILPKYAISDDSGCTGWQVLATSGATVGREIFLPYSRTPDLVHAEAFTSYTFVINAGSPTNYMIETLYDGIRVDVAEFDSGSTATQRYLFGQCYQVEVTNTNTGNSALIGTVCANDITQKNINIDTVTIPPNWQGRSWAWNLDRDFSNSTDNSILFTVEKDETPFDANIRIESSIYQNGTISQWFNFTNQNSAVILMEDGYFSNQTLWITVYDNSSDIVVRTVSSGKAFDLGDWSEPFGPVFGISMMGLMIVVVAGVFPRSMGTIAIIAVLVTAGVLWSIGWLDDMPVTIWAGLIGLAVIGIFADRRR